jgi:hypothetical protein
MVQYTVNLWYSIPTGITANRNKHTGIIFIFPGIGTVQFEPRPSGKSAASSSFAAPFPSTSAASCSTSSAPTTLIRVPARTPSPEAAQRRSRLQLIRQQQQQQQLLLLQQRSQQQQQQPPPLTATPQQRPTTATAAAAAAQQQQQLMSSPPVGKAAGIVASHHPLQSPSSAAQSKPYIDVAWNGLNPREQTEKKIEKGKEYFTVQYHDA